jgi:hypothetical protein
MTAESVQRGGAPAMTRCHFAFIASVIAAMSEREAVAQAFAAKLAQTNTRFDRERFLVACGLKS